MSAKVLGLNTVEEHLGAVTWAGLFTQSISPFIHSFVR